MPRASIWESEWLLRIVEWGSYTLAMAIVIGLLVAIRTLVHHLIR